MHNVAPIVPGGLLRDAAVMLAAEVAQAYFALRLDQAGRFSWSGTAPCATARISAPLACHRAVRSVG